MADQEGIERVQEQGNKSSLIPKIAIGLAVLALQAGGSVVLVKKLVPPKPPAVSGEALQKNTHGKKDFGLVYLVEDVIVNPAGSPGRRFLNTSVAFVYDEGKVGSELEQRDVQIRDMLLRVLGSYRADQLANPSFRDSLRAAVLQEVNRILNSGEVSEVYFATFVMQ